MTGASARSKKATDDARLRQSGLLFKQIDLPHLQEAQPTTKGERTRARLLQSALDVFRKSAFHAARVSDICQGSGISQGTFYIYFQDKEDIAAALMKLLLERLTRHVLDTPHFDDPFDAILESNRRYAEFFDQDGQFNRAVMQIFDTLPSMKAMSAAVNQAVAERISESLRRRVPGSAEHPRERLAMAHAMLGMIDALYFGYFSTDAGPMRELFASGEELVEFASFMWFRGLFGCNPPSRPNSTRLLKILDQFVVPGKPRVAAVTATKSARARRL